MFWLTEEKYPFYVSMRSSFQALRIHLLQSIASFLFFYPSCMNQKFRKMRSMGQTSSKSLQSTLSEKIAHSTVFHHLSHLSVDNQWSGLIKYRENSGVQTKLTRMGSHSVDWTWPQCTVLMELTQVASSPVNGKYTWGRCLKTGQKLHFSQLPNQHGTTWAVTSTAQWADCFWECRVTSGIYWMIKSLLSWDTIEGSLGRLQ